MELLFDFAGDTPKYLYEVDSSSRVITGVVPE